MSEVLADDIAVGGRSVCILLLIELVYKVHVDLVDILLDWRCSSAALLLLRSGVILGQISFPLAAAASIGALGVLADKQSPFLPLFVRLSTASCRLELP